MNKMHITEFFEQYIKEPGLYELKDVVMPDGRLCDISIVTQYVGGMNHHDIEIWDHYHGENMSEHVVEHWCKDVSDWLVEPWEEGLKQ